MYQQYNFLKREKGRHRTVQVILCLCYKISKIKPVMSIDAKSMKKSKEWEGNKTQVSGQEDVIGKHLQ